MSGKARDMRHGIAVFLFLLGLTAPTLAQTSPKEIVVAFYVDYTKAIETPSESWVKILMNSQKEHLEQPLVEGMLRLADGDPSKGEPYVDFDPFSNSQVGLESYRIGEPTSKDGLVYVPVFMRLERLPGPERMRARFVLRNSESGWKIANVVYPAEDGMPAWSLKGYLQETFQR